MRSTVNVTDCYLVRIVSHKWFFSSRFNRAKNWVVIQWDLSTSEYSIESNLVISLDHSTIENQNSNIEFLTNRKTFVYDYSLLIIGFESYHWVENRHELLKTNHPIAYTRVLTGQIILNWNVRPLSLYVKPVMAGHPSAINILLIFLFINLPDYFYHKKGWLNAKSANVAKYWSFPLPYEKKIFIQRILLLHHVLRFC